MTTALQITKIQDAQEIGEYKPTELDKVKKEVDFRIVQTSPYYIRWTDGRGEVVNARQLKKLQKDHTWATDF